MFGDHYFERCNYAKLPLLYIVGYQGVVELWDLVPGCS